MPKEVRRSFFAIRAFNCEIAQIRDQSRHNFMTGRIRFQFWRDCLDKIYGMVNSNDGESINYTTAEISDHPVMQELVQCVGKHSLTRRFFERSIEARISDFSETSYESLSDLERYAELSQSSLLYLVLECLGLRGTDNKTAYAASHVGCCYGIVTLLRGFSYHLSHGVVYLPESAVQQHNVNLKNLMGRRITDLSDGDLHALSAAIFEVASLAQGHLEEARKIIANGELEKAAIYALLPGVRSNIFLQTLQRENFNILAENFVSPNNDQLKYQLYLLRAVWFEKV